MKAIFVAYNQAYNEEIVDLLEEFGQRGYTKWEDVGGRGSIDGEPHLGSHAWPTQNHALFTACRTTSCPTSWRPCAARTLSTRTLACALIHGQLNNL